MAEASHSSRAGPAAVALLLLLAALGSGPGVAVAQDPPAEAFVVELDESGDATETLVSTYDLADDAESEAFDEFSANASAHAERFRDRLNNVAQRTAAETSREMRVTDPEATVETVDGVGVVRLSVRWDGLAAVKGAELAVAEPFASRFDPDRRLVIVAPDGYTVSETAVPPAENTGDVARWSANTDLSGFTTTLAPSEGGTGLSAPTPLAPTLGLVAAGALVHAIRRRLA